MTLVSSTNANVGRTFFHAKVSAETTVLVVQFINIDFTAAILHNISTYSNIFYCCFDALLNFTWYSRLYRTTAATIG